MEYQAQSLSKYLDDLSAKLPAPGGGSAAALNAALGASLISMVVNFTLGKSQYLSFTHELEETLSKSEKLRKKFLVLVDLDVLAYRSKNPQQALDVPLELARLCAQAAELCPPLIAKSNLNLVSDLAIAVVLLDAAFICASWNIKINLKNLKQQQLTDSLNKEIKQLSKQITKIRKSTEARVGKIIRR